MADKIETTIGALVPTIEKMDPRGPDPALVKLIGLRLDAKTRYHALKLFRLVEAEVREHFFKPQQDALKEFGAERDPTPLERARTGPDRLYDILIAKPEKQAAFFARINELAAVPVTIPWGPVTSTMLDPYQEFTGADMQGLGPLFLFIDNDESK